MEDAVLFAAIRRFGNVLLLILLVLLAPSTVRAQSGAKQLSSQQCAKFSRGPSEPIYKNLQLAAQPALPLAVGSSTGNSLLKPGLGGVQVSYKGGIVSPSIPLESCHTEVLGLFFSRQYGNNTALSLGRELLGAFSISNVNLITDSFYFSDQVSPNGSDVPSNFTINVGSQFAHAPCCNVINSQFNPDSVYHAAFVSVDDYFGPVIYVGTKNAGMYQRVFDVMAQYSEGSHVSNDAYLQSQAAMGQSDGGAQGLLSLRPQATFLLGKGNGETYGYVNYVRTAQRYDNSPQPLYTNSYNIAVDHAFTDWLTGEVYGTVVAGQGYSRGFAFPTNTNNSSINLDLQFVQPW